jgi:hypothetical protein
MPLAADYPFLEVLGTLLIFFLFVSWFWLLIIVIGDVFTRHDIKGWKKAAWLLFLLIVPFIGVFAYLIVNSDGMAQRRAERALPDYARREQLDADIPRRSASAAPPEPGGT